jgi:hypothetical protein
MRTLALASLFVLAAPAFAQEASPFPTEPKVQRIVVEDDNLRIEELRVRGITQRIVVTPKTGNAKPYEILPGDGARDLSSGPHDQRGAVGKRVWNVFTF